MLVPKLRLVTVEMDNGERKCCCLYCVWDTEKEDYVQTVYFSNYTTEKECQKAIDFFNSFKIVKVS